MKIAIRLLVVAFLLFSGLHLPGCAFMGANLYAGRMPIACGTWECLEQKAKFDEKMAKERERRSSKAVKIKEKVEKTYGVTIPMLLAKDRYNRCILRGGTPDTCAPHLGDKWQRR